MFTLKTLYGNILSKNIKSHPLLSFFYKIHPLDKDNFLITM